VKQVRIPFVLDQGTSGCLAKKVTVALKPLENTRVGFAKTSGRITPNVMSFGKRDRRFHIL